MRTIETSYKPSVPSATTQLTIRRLHVYHVTRYLWQNYILSKRVVPSNRSVHVRACRGIFPTVNGRSTEHVEADRILFPFLFPRSTGTGNRQQRIGAEKAAGRARRHRSAPYTCDRGACTPARALLCGWLPSRERERIGSPSPHDLFSRRVKRKVITIADPWITLYVMQALFFLFLSYFNRFLSSFF